MTIAALLGYTVVLLALGVVARRASSKSPDEYFLAGRSLGPFVLFMALFGTNSTSFVLVAIPAMAYVHGIAVFGLNAPIVALGIPLTFWAIGVPARSMAKRLGALTPAELYSKRFQSPAVGALLFVLFTLYTIPYMVQAVKSAALILAAATDGQVGPETMALGVLVVALLYTSLGGMRATAWTNVFQGGVFLVFMLAAVFFVARSLGGADAATASVIRVDEALLVRGDVWLFTPKKWTSWGLVIALTVIGFPHMFARLMAARDERSIRTVVRWYPLMLGLLWVPAVLLGFWGRGAFPDLGEPDAIFQRMTAVHMPKIVGSLGFLAVLAAVMSTLDAMILTLSSMCVRDGVLPFRQLDERSQVVLARTFTGLIVLVVWILSVAWGESLFEISRVAFEGYTTIVPTLLLGVRWRRFTAAGAIASLVGGAAVLLVNYSVEGLEWAGFLPVFWALALALVLGVVVSWVTPEEKAASDIAFGP